MARGINKVILIGNLGRDPDIRYTQGGACIANASLATGESWTDKETGEKKEKVEWHNLVFFNQLAEIVASYLKKGAKIYVEGKLTTQKYVDKNGIERYSTKIMCHTMQMLDSKGDAQTEKPLSPEEAQKAAEEAVDRAEKAMDGHLRTELEKMDDIPF